MSIVFNEKKIYLIKLCSRVCVKSHGNFYVVEYAFKSLFGKAKGCMFVSGSKI